MTRVSSDAEHETPALKEEHVCFTQRNKVLWLNIVVFLLLSLIIKSAMFIVQSLEDTERREQASGTLATISLPFP